LIGADADKKSRPATTASCLPVCCELQRLQKKIDQLSLKLREKEQLCAEELTLILSKTFDGKAVIVQPAAAIR